MTPPASRAPAPASPPWGALQIALAIVVLLQVWRVPGWFPRLAIHGLPILGTVAAVALFALSNDLGRRLNSLTHPIVLAALGIVVLVALSVPGACTPAAARTSC